MELRCRAADAAAVVISRMREACLSGLRLLSDHQPDRLRVECADRCAWTTAGAPASDVRSAQGGRTLIAQIGWSSPRLNSPSSRLRRPAFFARSARSRAHHHATLFSDHRPATGRPCPTAFWPHSVGSAASDRYYADDRPLFFRLRRNGSRRPLRFANNRHGSLLGIAQRAGGDFAAVSGAAISQPFPAQGRGRPASRCPRWPGRPHRPTHSRMIGFVREEHRVPRSLHRSKAPASLDL